MGQDPTNKPRPGFQGSETSWVELIVYSQGGDPIVVKSKGRQSMQGRYRTDPDHTLITLGTNKGLASTGNFQATIKPSRSSKDSPLERVVDDDWVDVVFHRHDKTWHTMRGLVTDLRRTRTVTANGATSWTYTLAGQDFQRIFDITPIWFNRFSQKLENAAGSLALQIFTGVPNIGGSPTATVRGMLMGWFRELQNLGRATWKIPETVPNTLGTFYQDIERGWNSEGFSGVPERSSINPNLMNPSGNLWQLAKEWADPGFLEFFCDLGKFGAQLPAGEELRVEDSTISVFLRDRPFPLHEGLTDHQGIRPPITLGIGRDSAWFNLPTHIVPRQQVGSDDLGRSGSERYNAFFVSPQTTMELTRTAPPDMLPPLWDESDILLHGLRRYDVSTKYKAEAGTLLALSTIQRQMARDWFAINPYLLNGTIPLGVLRPEIHVGTRILIPGDNGDTSQDETYYVENVAHNWTFGPGGKTVLSVTRGWQGDDNSLLQAVTELAGRYRVPNIGDPEAVEDWATA